jgi:DNA-binding transcriptional LysR family regulator
MANWLARPYVEQGKLVCILPGVKHKIPIYAVMPSATGMPERVRVVLDFLQSCIGPAIAHDCAPD